MANLASSKQDRLDFTFTFSSEWDLLELSDGRASSGAIGSLGITSTGWRRYQ